MIGFNEIDLNEINKQLMSRNYEHVNDFEGITSYEMHGLLHFVFDSKRSPLQINEKIENEKIKSSKFFCDIKYYLEKIIKEQPIKLTQNGNLPKQFCQDLIDDKIEIDHWFENKKIRKETDSYIIHLLHVIGKVSGLTKTIKGQLTLTKTADKLLKSDKYSELFFHIFKLFSKKFNWGYSDGYGRFWIIQAGFDYTIYLLKKYGSEEKEIEFYSEKYLKAFPTAIEECNKTYMKPEEEFRNCYKIRVFERFLCLFSLAKIIGKENYQTGEKKRYAKTELFDEIFSFAKIPPTVR